MTDFRRPWTGPTFVDRPPLYELLSPRYVKGADLPTVNARCPDGVAHNVLKRGSDGTDRIVATFFSANPRISHRAARFVRAMNALVGSD